MHEQQPEPRSIQTCFPHPIRPFGPPSPLRGEGGNAPTQGASEFTADSRLVARSRRLHVLIGLAALLLSSSAAFASCVTGSPPDTFIHASAGETCFASGLYSTATPGVVAGESLGPGTILTNGEGTASFATTGVTTPALLAAFGGAINLTGGTVTTSGDGSQGALVDGVGSTITMSGIDVTTSGGFDSETGSFADGLFAAEGGSASFTGGSITTSGASAVAVASAGAGSKITLTGGSETPLTIQTTGNGGIGVAVNGAGASLTATGVTITTSGGIDSSSGIAIPAFGAYNGAGPGTTAGGLMTLTNTSITTTGTGADGVVAATGGVTTINGGTVSTSGAGALGLYATGAGSSITTLPYLFGDVTTYTTVATTGSNAPGVLAQTGGAVTLNGGSVSTSGETSFGLWASGSGASITSNGTAIATGVPFDDDSTAGAYAHGVLANAGGAVTLNGGSVSTAGTNAIGLYATGAGSAITTTNLAATGPVTITTTGADSPGVQADSGGTVALSGGSVTTSGVDSSGSSRAAQDRASPPRAGRRSRPPATMPTAFWRIPAARLRWTAARSRRRENFLRGSAS